MDLKKIKMDLEQRQQELMGRLQRIEMDMTHRDAEREQNMEDQAQDLEHEEVLGALDGIERAELALVNRTLLRIEVGNYGTCMTCDSEISPARLKAYPHALECVDCANERSNNSQPQL